MTGVAILGRPLRLLFEVCVVALALFLCSAMVPIETRAEAIPTLGDTLEIQLTPNNPAPEQPIIAQAINLPSAAGSLTFIWRVNGQIVDQGQGRDSVTLTAGLSGSVSTISVSVISGGSTLIEKSVTIRPSSVTLVWEGATYTPPLYLGLPLPTGESLINVTAIPEILVGGVRVPRNSLVYSWHINGSSKSFRSGLGVHTVSPAPPQFGNPFDVSVVVQNQSGSVSAATKTTITPTRPDVLVYEKAPLLGLRIDKLAERSLSLSEDEITLVGFPLYINRLEIPEYEWTVGGNRTENTGNTVRELTLRKEGEGGGQTRVSFGFKNPSTLFEQALSNFLVNF